MNESSEIHYVTGDATQPIGDGPKVIAHVCNDVGAWGAGFVLALSARDRRPEAQYRRHVTGADDSSLLGYTYFGPFDPSGQEGENTGVDVANMVAQRGFKTVLNDVPLDYKALRVCLDGVGFYAAEKGATVHMPRIGCGLGGGKWETVEEAILAILVDVYGLDVYVYDLPQAAS
jgi:hypothetical protein